MTLEIHLLSNNLFIVSTYTVPEIMGSGREVSNNTSLIDYCALAFSQANVLLTVVMGLNVN
jgi:hypothetical protein